VRRAAFYYRAVDFFLPYSHPRKMEIYDRAVGLMRKYYSPYFREGRIKEYYVPYGRGRLPVWHAPAAAHKSKGAIVLTGGFDCLKEELVPVVIYFSNAGYDFYFFEGPGQGETLVKEGIPMTHEWEKPIAAVLDRFRLDNVTLIGLSLGAYLAPRAAVREPRIKRVIAWGIMYDFFRVVISRRGRFLEGFIRALLSLRLSFVLNGIVRMKMKRDAYTHWGVEHGMRVLGASSPARYFKALKKFTLKHELTAVGQDVLLTSGSEDHFVPLSQFHACLKGLRNARSVTGRVFSARESAENHCQFGNIALTLDVFLSWIDFQSGHS
jgi:pimeloyl-ACP methyl ester carboxylesterase